MVESVTESSYFFKNVDNPLQIAKYNDSIKSNFIVTTSERSTFDGGA